SDTALALDPVSVTMPYVGMNDHCAWYLKNKNINDGAGGGGTVVKDWPMAAKLEAGGGWITAINGRSGAVQWQYQAESQVQVGLVTTKSGLLFGGDTHGNLLVFDATNGDLLNSIDTGGALNSGLISYSVGRNQYVAAAVGGVSENPSTAAGARRGSIYGLGGSGKPELHSFARLELPPSPGALGETTRASAWLFFQNCSQCQGSFGGGVSAPPITRQSQLADPELLKQFLATVPPPMPRLYPGVLEDNDVALIADYLKTRIFTCGPDEPNGARRPPTPRPPRPPPPPRPTHTQPPPPPST